jgi:putative RecB family exonuclease
MIATLERLLSPQSKKNGSPDRAAELQKTISASRLGLWLQCRLKFFFRYIAQVQRPPTPSMHAGSTVHAVLQSWNIARWRREPFAIERLKALFVSQWTGLQEGARINWREQEDSQRNSSWRALVHYFGQTPIGANEKPEAVEVTVEADLSRNGLPTLVGIIDLVRARGRIVDFKLTGKTPSAVHAVHMHELQLTCYSLLYRDATGKKESALELHHLVRTKEPKLIVSSMPPSTDHQKTRLFRQIESYQTGLARLDFVPSPGFHCAGCEYFNECRLWCGKETHG